jgi:hypothetical protein
MGDHSTISTESGPGSSAVPSHPALTRRRLLGGAGIAVGAVIAPLPDMLGVGPAAAQGVSAEAATTGRRFSAPRPRGSRRLRTRV